MVDAVKTKELKIIPVEEEETWFRWIGNLRIGVFPGSFGEDIELQLISFLKKDKNRLILLIKTTGSLLPLQLKPYKKLH